MMSTFVSIYLGGNKGFDKKVWQVAEHNNDGQNPFITFKYHSNDGEEGNVTATYPNPNPNPNPNKKQERLDMEEARVFSPYPNLLFPLKTGYPGAVNVTATYTLTSTTTMRLDMEAVPQNKPTPINLAQHTYWNLSGHGSGTILNHSVQIFATHITPVDQNSIPTGELVQVTKTPFDFTTEKIIGTSISEVGLGYDHNYVLSSENKKNGLKHAAKVKDPESSRVLNLWTNAPGMQYYTANYVDGVVGKSGAVYGKHSGLCLETQGFPNAVNEPKFPSVIVQPGEKYGHSMLFEFSTE